MRGSAKRWLFLSSSEVIWALTGAEAHCMWLVCPGLRPTFLLVHMLTNAVDGGGWRAFHML
jgi:hypothetical protein